MLYHFCTEISQLPFPLSSPLPMEFKPLSFPILPSPHCVLTSHIPPPLSVLCSYLSISLPPPPLCIVFLPLNIPPPPPSLYCVLTSQYPSPLSLYCVLTSQYSSPTPLCIVFLPLSIPPPLSILCSYLSISLPPSLYCVLTSQYPSPPSLYCVLTAQYPFPPPPPLSVLCSNHKEDKLLFILLSSSTVMLDGCLFHLSFRQHGKEMLMLALPAQL